MTPSVATATKLGSPAPFPIDAVRASFPALGKAVGEEAFAFFDGPGGTQMCGQAISAMSHYIARGIANIGGVFETSGWTQELSDKARAAAADLIGANAEEIAFGPNMTTLTFAVSRALARNWRGGDEIVVTRLDHDANIMPWLEVAAERDMVVRWVDFDPVSGALDLDQLERMLGPKTRLVALTAASNALGSLVPIAAAAKIIRSRCNTTIFVDGVQSVPHVQTDVNAMDCDFLVWSAYKFFGPHLGVLWAKEGALSDVRAYKVRPAGNMGPRRFETGAPSFEAHAGLVGAIDYLEWLGASIGGIVDDRRSRLCTAVAASREYEEQLGRYLLAGLDEVRGLRLWGTRKMSQRVPTFGFTIDERDPLEAAEFLAKRRITIWSGHFYAVEAIARLGLDKSGGLIRVGLCHYNRVEEVDRLLAGLHEFVGR